MSIAVTLAFHRDIGQLSQMANNMPTDLGLIRDSFFERCAG